MSPEVCPVQQHTTFEKGTHGTFMGVMFKLDNIEKETHPLESRAVHRRGLGRKNKTQETPWPGPRRLALLRATPRAEADVFNVQRCQIAKAIFP